MARFTPVVLILDQTLSPPDGREFFLHRLKTSNEDLKTGISSLLKKSFFSDCSKMPRCKAPEILRSEAYLDVRRNDEG